MILKDGLKFWERVDPWKKGFTGFIVGEAKVELLAEVKG